MSSYCYLEWGLIQVQGPDAATFLQGQWSCDLRKISGTHSSLAAYCAPNGRVQAIARIFAYHDSFMIRLPITILENTLKRMQKFAVFSKVTLSDQTQNFVGIGWYDTQPIHTSDSVVSFAVPSDGPLRFESYGNINTFQKPNLEKLSFEAWELLEIRAGLPAIYPSTQDQILPHHLNLEELGALCYDKGCYSGQEIIARMHYRSKIKQHTYHALAPLAVNELMPGEAVFVNTAGSHEAPGIILQAATCNSNKLESEVLICIKDQYWANITSTDGIRLKSLEGPKLLALG